METEWWDSLLQSGKTLILFPELSGSSSSKDRRTGRAGTWFGRNPLIGLDVRPRAPGPGDTTRSAGICTSGIRSLAGRPSGWKGRLYRAKYTIFLSPREWPTP